MTRESDASIPLTASDAWLLAAATEGSDEGVHVSLREFVHDADWLNRQIPTFDEASFGLARLAAAGFITTSRTGEGAMVIQPLAKALALRHSVTATSLGGVLLEMEAKLGVGSRPENAEDRSSGRLPGLTLEEWEAALREHSDAIRQRSEPWISAAQELIKRQQEGL